MEVKKEWNYSYDFVKGIAALIVVIEHSVLYEKLGPLITSIIPNAVPFFLFVTSAITFESFSRGKTLQKYYSNTLTMLKRLFQPFLSVTLILSIIYLTNAHIKGIDFTIYDILSGGGIGPGSYYPWMHLQVWLLLPFVVLLINKLSLNTSFILFVSLSIFLEIISSICQIPEPIYRLLFYRYLFLIYLACIVKKYNLKITPPIIILGCIGLCSIFIFKFTQYNFEPFFFNSWRTSHWICYFYSVLLLLALIAIYKKVSHTKVSSFILILGRNSFEIFLSQMFVYSIVKLPHFSFVNSALMQGSLYVLVTFFLSIAPVLMYKFYLKKFFLANE